LGELKPAFDKLQAPKWVGAEVPKAPQWVLSRQSREAARFPRDCSEEAGKKGGTERKGGKKKKNGCNRLENEEKQIVGKEQR